MASKPKVVLFLNRQSLTVLSESRKLESIDLKEDIFSDLEVVNHGNFVERVSELLRSLRVKKTEAVLVFAKDTVFEKYVPSSGTDTTETEKSFFTSVPFEDRIMAKKVIKDSKGERLIAVNGDVIRTFVLALVPLKVKLDAAVPATVYEISGGGNSLSVADGLVILAKGDILQKANFLELKKEEKKEEVEGLDDLEDDKPDKPRFNQKILLVIGVLLIGGAIFLTLISLGIVKNPLTKEVKKTRVTAPTNVVKSPLPTVAPSPVLPNNEATKSSKEATKEASNEAVLVP